MSASGASGASAAFGFAQGVPKELLRATKPRYALMGCGKVFQTLSCIALCERGVGCGLMQKRATEDLFADRRSLRPTENVEFGRDLLNPLKDVPINPPADGSNRITLINTLSIPSKAVAIYWEYSTSPKS